MKIGVPRERKVMEFRVGMVPDAVGQLCACGHEVRIERGAGGGSGFADEAFERVGARLVERDEVWASDLVVKVKEPQPEEVPLLRGSPCSDGEGAKGDGAFLVGMLSLVDVLLGRPLAEIVDELCLDDEIREALLERRGPLGSLLRLVEDLEQGDFEAVADRAQAFGLGAAETARAEMAACRWVHALDVSDV